MPKKKIDIDKYLEEAGRKDEELRQYMKKYGDYSVHDFLESLPETGRDMMYMQTAGYSPEQLQKIKLKEFENGEDLMRGSIDYLKSQGVQSEGGELEVEARERELEQPKEKSRHREKKKDVEYKGILGGVLDVITAPIVQPYKFFKNREARYLRGEKVRRARYANEERGYKLKVFKENLKLRRYGIDQLKDILKEEKNLGRTSFDLLRGGKIKPDEFLEFSQEIYKDRRKTLEDLEKLISVVLILVGAFFISMSKEGMNFTGNFVMESNFVSTNGLGIGVILLIVALVVLFVKFLIRP